MYTTHFLNLRDQLCSVETWRINCAHWINLRDQYCSFAKNLNQLIQSLSSVEAGIRKDTSRESTSHIGSLVACLVSLNATILLNLRTSNPMNQAFTSMRGH